MSTIRRTVVQLPDGAVEAEHDDAEDPAVYDETLAEELLAAATRYQDEHPDLVVGRPSLGAPGGHSPHLSLRVPAELAARLDEQSAAEGVSRSVLVRRALAEYLAAHRAG